MESFGKTLNNLRVGKKLTLREMSKYVGKSISYLSDIENDRKRPPDLETVRKIEEFLGIEEGRLINLALKLRRKIPKDVTQQIKMMPKLSEVLLRADDLTEEEISKVLNYMEEIKKRRE